MANWKIVIYGGVGGAFAPLLFAAQNLTETGALPSSLMGWMLGVLILFGLGALLAGASGESLPLKALAIGLSLPATVTAWQEHGTAQQLHLIQPAVAGAPAGGSGLSGLLVAPALAQTDRNRTLVVVAPPGLGNYEVHFYAPRPMTDHPATVAGPEGRRETIAVPALARSVAIWGPRGWSLPVPLPDSSPSGKLTLVISERSDFARSAWQAFGASASPYVVSIR